MQQRCRFTPRTCWRWPSLVLFLLLSSIAWAESTTTAQVYLASINRLYESLEYEDALKQIYLARTGPRSPGEDVALFHYEGIILIELGQQKQGIAAFKSALLLEPEATLPVQVAPKIQQLFESMHQEVEHELAAVHQAQPAQSSTADATTIMDTAPQRSDLSRYSLLPAIAGGTLVMAGGISWALSRAELNQLRKDDPKLATLEDVQSAISRGRTRQTVGVILLSMGVVGLATATGLYAASAHSMPVVLGVGTDGTSALVYGRWP